MMEIARRFKLFSGKPDAPGGFTLIELLVAMTIASVVGIAILTNFISQQRAATIVREVAQMQQQLRGATYIIEHDFRLTGYNPEKRDAFGVMDVKRDSVEKATWGGAVNTFFTTAYDWSFGNPATNGNGLRDEPRFTYGLFDLTGNGVTDLVRVEDIDLPNRQLAHVQLVAENIEAMGFAFAYSAGGGNLARDAGNNIIWAVDTNNDNMLDSRLDGIGGTTALGENIPRESIRMARIWLLARARSDSPGYINTERYVLGDQVIDYAKIFEETGTADRFRRRLLERTIEFFNMGLQALQTATDASIRSLA